MQSAPEEMHASSPPMRRKSAHAAHDESWLMSYADMITLLMCFFIIFVSVSEPKQDKLVEITKGMAERFGVIELSTPFLGTYQNVLSVVDRYNAFDKIALEKTDQGMEMELSSVAFFQDQTAELSQEMQPMLSEMITALSSVDYMKYHIIVEGHTDNIPLTKSAYASNWELSSARASRMVRFLIEHGVEPSRLRAIGFADTQPKVPNLDSGGQPIPENQRKNRRVVIKLVRE